MDDLGDVVVVDGVVDLLAVLPELDDAPGPEDPELVGHRRLGQAHDVADVADAKLAGEKGGDDLQAAGIGEGLEELAGIEKGVIVGHGGEDAVNRRFVVVVLLTGGFGDAFGIVCHGIPPLC